MPWGICITPHDSAIQSCHDLDSAATASLGGNPSTLAPQAPPGAASSTVSTPRRPHRTNHPPRDPGPGGQHASMQHLESRNGNCTAVITNGDSTPAAGPALSVSLSSPPCPRQHTPSRHRPTTRTPVSPCITVYHPCITPPPNFIPTPLRCPGPIRPASTLNRSPTGFRVDRHRSPPGSTPAAPVLPSVLLLYHVYHHF